MGTKLVGDGHRPVPDRGVEPGLRVPGLRAGVGDAGQAARRQGVAHRPRREADLLEDAAATEPRRGEGPGDHGDVHKARLSHPPFRLPGHRGPEAGHVRLVDEAELREGPRPLGDVGRPGVGGTARTRPREAREELLAPPHEPRRRVGAHGHAAGFQDLRTVHDTLLEGGPCRKGIQRGHVAALVRLRRGGEGDDGVAGVEAWELAGDNLH
mmetsp:Transcript_104101/g.324572  ORF Transcript_104101/g.324572 Transcript_104101/m.324572 type:complete len:211 (-) Transcript_104101:296-928(-)